MKHAGSEDALLQQRPPDDTASPLLPPLSSQSRASLVACFFCLLFLLAIVADPVVRDLAQALDPTALHVLRRVTQFGNSAYALVIGLFLIGWITLALRWGADLPAEATRDYRSSLAFLVLSVMASGFLASFTKNLIGRARPSIGPDVGVFDVTFFAFTPGLAAFPSGHATTAATVALVLVLLFPRHAWAWASVGAVAALSRALLGVHWLTDTLAGTALGVVVTLALHRWMTSRGHRFRMDPAVTLALARDARVQAIRLGKALLHRVRRTRPGRRRI